LPAAEVHGTRSRFLDVPYPGGESWGQAVQRVRSFLDDLSLRWEGRQILLVGHIATRWGLEHWLNNVPLPQLATTEFVWQDGWEYRLS
jgi:broad specificity phosphatase PhoE